MFFFKCVVGILFAKKRKDNQITFIRCDTLNRNVGEWNAFEWMNNKHGRCLLFYLSKNDEIKWNIN